RAGEQQVTQTRTGSVVLNERNIETGFIVGVNSDAGLAGSVVLNERNFVTGFLARDDFLFLNSLEYQVPLQANDQAYLVPFVDSGTVGSSPVPAETKAVTPKTDLDRLQGVWSVVSIEQGGKRSKLVKAVFMVDGKRACWQTSDSEIQGGLYLEPT